MLILSLNEAQLGAVADIDSKNEVVIFCDEEHHAMLGDPKSKFSTWDDTTWEGKDSNGNEAWVKIGREVSLGSAPNAPVPDPRQKICDSEKTMDAYTSLGESPMQQEKHSV